MISYTHRTYNVLQHPLLLLYGTDGYPFGIPQAGENAKTMQYVYEFIRISSYV